MRKTPPRTAGTPASFHPRNRHQGNYDLAFLSRSARELERFLQPAPGGGLTLDFADPQAVRCLNRALLLASYGIEGWELPNAALCPPIPGRADYIHYLADLLATDCGGEIPRGSWITGLDVGVGASCVYALIAHSEYGWRMVGSDIDRPALANARGILEANPAFANGITLRHQPSRQSAFGGIIGPTERFYLSLCNPPFYANDADARAGAERKWRGLGRENMTRDKATRNFGGSHHELCCAGGEVGFIERMIAESTGFRDRCLWFTSLVSRASSLPALRRALSAASVVEWRTIEMAQGNKTSRFIAWTYQRPAARTAWYAVG